MCHIYIKTLDNKFNLNVKIEYNVLIIKLTYMFFYVNKFNVFQTVFATII